MSYNFDSLLAEYESAKSQAETVANLSEEKQLELLGSLIDLSCNLIDLYHHDAAEGIQLAIKSGESILKQDISAQTRTILYYFMANAWAQLRKTENRDPFAFIIPQQIQELRYLRKALFSKGFPSIDLVLKGRILTNLGNTLSNIGRIPEALEIHNQALEIDRRNPMAWGNNGMTVFSYSKVLFDDGHIPIFWQMASTFFKPLRAVPKSIPPHAKGGFQQHWEFLQTHLPSELFEVIPRFGDHSWGDSKIEQAYRKWSAENRLFINPLNDVTQESVVAHDCLNLPGLTLPIDQEPIWIDYFNQIKQEFASARFILFEAGLENDPHFSDRGVVLINTLKYSNHFYALEKYKLGIRTLFSIFDKIAVCLLDYLGGTAKRIDFNNVWGMWNKKTNQFDLREEFQGSKNYILRGLFWLSRDLHRINEHDEFADPEIRKLKTLRNALEHRFVMILDHVEGDMEERGNHLIISRKEIIYLSLKLMKLVRNAIIMLSLGIHLEERLKGPPEGLVGNMPMDTIDDDWKR